MARYVERAKGKGMSMKRASSRLLLGLLGVATSAGLVLGGKAVVDSVAKGAAEVNAAEAVEKLSATFSSDEVVTSTAYSKYENDDWGITFGGNNKSIGTNSGKRSDCVLTGDNAKFAVSPITSSMTATAFYSKAPLSSISKVTMSYGGGKNANRAHSYLLSSTDGDEYSLVDINGALSQGSNINSTNTEYSFEFDSLDAYFAVVVVDSGNSGDFRLDNFTADFYSYESAPEDLKVTSIELAVGEDTTNAYLGVPYSAKVRDFSVTLNYTSETNPSFNYSENVEPYDERLTWSTVDTSEKGPEYLSVSVGDVDSNALDIEVVDAPVGSKHMFGESEAFLDWNVSYAARTLNYPGLKVEFESANKQQDSGKAVITDMPVTKGSKVTIVSFAGPLSFAEVGLKQWAEKEQNATMSVGADIGHLEEVSDIAVQGTTSISATGAFEVAQITFSSQEDQVGIAYADVKFAYEQTPADPNIAKVQEFVDTYMHLDDYNANEGKCLGADGYYVKARTALIALGEECIELFKTAEQFAAAKERYENWAEFNGDANPYSGTFTASAAARINNDDHAEYWIVGGISIVAIGVAAALFFLRKKKEA